MISECFFFLNKLYKGVFVCKSDNWIERSENINVSWLLVRFGCIIWVYFCIWCFVVSYY